MGRRRTPFPRSRVPLARRLLLDPVALRRWLVVAALAVVVVAGVGHAVARAERAERRWGSTRPVLVATAAVAPGRPLAEAVRTEAWPAGLVPDGALGHLPEGARATSAIAAGTPLTEADLAADAGLGPRPQVALPAGASPLPLEAGDRVDVWATFDPTLAGTGPATRPVALAAEVVSGGGEVVVVAVDEDDVADLVAAAALATPTLVRHP